MQLNIPVVVTEVVAGWITTSEHDCSQASPEAYWVESLDIATESIYTAIQQKAPVAYITARQEKVVALLKTIPNDLYNALSARPGGAI